MTPSAVADPSVAEPVPGSKRISRFAVALALLLMLIPSGIFAWRYRTMPQFGSFHDDAVYWASAQSLADGHGYHIPHLPEQPAQTKYPPLYPALLALIAKFAGPYPGSLTAVTAFQWSFLPILAALSWMFFRRCGMGTPASLFLTLIVAAGPMTTIFAVQPMSELPFTTVLLGIMLLIDTGKSVSTRRAFLAGVLAAAAFLIRTNVIVLVASAPLIWLYRRQRAAAAAFALPLLVSICGWVSWCAAHAFPSRDFILFYYTNYLGFYVRTFSLVEFPSRVWSNFDSIVESLARLVFFNTGEQLWMRLAAWVAAPIAVAGVAMLIRRGVRQYTLFAVLFVLVLLVWEFPSDARFLYPVFPLYLAGLFTKLQQVAQLAICDYKAKRGGSRFGAAIFLSLIVLIGAGAIASAALGDSEVLPRYFADHEKQRAQMQPVYRWIAAEAPGNAVFAAYDDALLYLNTGRRGYTVPILPVLVYGSHPDAVGRYVSELPALWREKRVDYVLATQWDFQRDLHQPAQDALAALLKDRSEFQPIYADSFASVYRFTPR